MNLEMKYRRRRYYLYGRYSDYNTAKRKGKQMRNITGCRYQIVPKRGKVELWLTDTC